VSAAPPREVTAPQTPISKWRLVVASMFIAIFLFVGLAFFRSMMPANWEFSIEAATEVAEIFLPPKSTTHWQVDGATICARRALELPQKFQLKGHENPCGGRAWIGWSVPHPEQVLELHGDVTVVMQVDANGRFAMSLRSANNASLGLLSVVGLFEDVILHSELNLIWSELPAQPITLPFSGATTLGRTVSWAGVGMLRSGNIVVYTADDSADRRTKVDDAKLMLGDQVGLEIPGADEAWPKGFIRIYSGDKTMKVVAFGRADSLRIERYGESGYHFAPGPIAKLLSDATIGFLGSLLGAYITLVLSLQPFVEGNTGNLPPATIWQRFQSWFRKRPLR